MDLKERRERIQQLQSDLANGTSNEAQWVRELLELQFEDAKERLIEAEGIDVPRIQGEARFLEKQFKMFAAASALLRNHKGA